MLRALLLSLCLCLPVGALAESQTDTRLPGSRAEMAMSFAPLVKEAAPAVVNIYAKRVVQSRESPFSADPFFRDFFEGFAPSRPQVQNALGSGVILTPDGFVVSNYHVVGDATDIRVVLKDRREFSAEVVLGDEASDLAILRLRDIPGALPYLALRDSTTVEVGELVLAIGNPFGVGQTVSSGIISGLARSGRITGNLRGYFMQTDAPINPGNSGGALIGMDGALIGVNTAIVTRSGGSNGICFAIPAGLVEQFLAQARAGASRFARPWAGIGGQAVDADLAESLGLAQPGGMAITDVSRGSPFAAAGLQQGDVVLSAEGRAVNSPSEMLYYMTLAGIGGEIEIEAARGAQRETYRVAMIAPPDVPARDTRRLGARSPLPGLQFARVNPAVIAEYGLPVLPDGVTVLELGEFGARVGLHIGDLLREINGRAIESPRAAESAFGRSGRNISLVVERGGQMVLLRFRV